MPRFSNVILVDPAGRLLLQERDEHPVIDPECWGLPGGHLEDDESDETAAYRELAEETGVALPPGSLRPLAEFEVWHEAYGSLDVVATFLGSCALTDAEIVCREGRRMVFVEPDVIPTLPLTHSARQIMTTFLGSPDHLAAQERSASFVRVAAVALVDVRGWVLLQERDEHAPFDPERWSFPGGGLEGAETYAEAARRELAEETGVQLGADTLQLVGHHSTIASATSLDCDFELWAASTDRTDEDVECHEGRQMVFVDPSVALGLDLTHPTRLALTDFLDSDLYRKLATR
ncbi:hypothetical protein BH09ACT12_BH09ACT12_30910 [soil metagenome]